MIRKGFDIEEAELARTKRAAARLGISVNRYLAQAVIEKNDDTDGQDRLAALEQRVLAAIETLQKEMLQARLEIVADAERSSALMREEANEVLGRSERLVIGVIRALPEQLKALAAPPSSPPGKPTNPTKPPKPEAADVYPQPSDFFNN